MPLTTNLTTEMAPAHRGRHRIATSLLGTVGAFVAAGGATALWGFVEAHAYVLRRRSIVLTAPAGLPATEGENGSDTAARLGGRSLRILHLSDIHLMPHQRHKQEWIESLAASNPDLLVLTGDQLSSADALPGLIESLAPFADIPGVFVFGSNDYYSPRLKNPFSYLTRQFGSHTDEPRNHLARERDLPWEEMTRAFEEFGWINLNNARAQVQIGPWDVECVGVDDPHIKEDHFPAPDESTGDDSAADTRAGLRVKIGLTHAPYRHVLDDMVADGCSVIFAGHTHGGQLRLPGYGTIVTNCDIDRHHAYGLFRWPVGGKIVRGDGSVSLGSRAGNLAEGGVVETRCAWVNVTTGLGTSPYTPIRVACRPEAVQIDVIAL